MAPYSVEADARASFAADRVARRGDWLRRAGGIGLVAALFVAALAYVILSAQLRPFRYWDAAALIGTAILPAEIVLACFFAQDHPLALARSLARFRGQGLRQKFGALAGVVVFGLVLPVNLVLTANQALDASPATPLPVQVVRTWIQHHRGGETFYAGVEPAPAPLRLGSFYADQPVAVPAALWRTLVPGRSTLTLAVRPGRLGLPWYERLTWSEGRPAP